MPGPREDLEASQPLLEEENGQQHDDLPQQEQAQAATNSGRNENSTQQPTEHASCVEVEEDLPPAYSNEVWKDSRMLGEDLESPNGNSNNGAAGSADSSFEDPFANCPEGPRTVRIQRAANGFGFTIGGSAPCRAMTVTDQAVDAGLVQYDQILEVNGVDVTDSTIAQVSSLIQEADSMLNLIVIPGMMTNDQQPTTMALHMIDESRLTLTDRLLMEGNGVGMEIDPTQRPPSHLLPAAASVVCCPLVGCAAVWHSKQVAHAWDSGHFGRARLHSIMSRKLAGSAVFYGIVIIMMWLFVTTSQGDEFPRD